MDFNDTPEEAAFRAEAVAWLSKNAKLKADARGARRGDAGDKENVARAQAWQAKKADAGWACLLWPEAYGGRGLSSMHHVIFASEEAKYDVPRGACDSGLGMCGPTLMAFAGEADKRRYLPEIARGGEIWCQLFSEACAGSDLAGLRTRADRRGEDWIVNGRKSWISYAHAAQFAVLLARSDFKAHKHAGMTFFFLDMRSPGVEVRPLRQIDGGAHFCEVSLNDVRVPDAQRLGEVGQGWRVALTTLMNERMNVGTTLVPDFEELLELARTTQLEDGPAIEDAAVRERLADWYVQARGLEYTRYRALTALSRGQTPAPEGSIGKLVSASKMQGIASFGLDLIGAGGAIIDEADLPMNALFQRGMLQAPGARVGGGTDEILRNIIAERVLGLPGDVRVDKGVPFDEILTGSAN